MNAFLRSSRGWVDEQRGLLAPSPPPLVAGDRLALLDGELLLVARARESGRTRVRREGASLVVDNPPGGADLDAPVERWYRREARTLLAERSRSLAGALGAHLEDVTVRDPRSRWGSCSRRGRLSYSWRLLLAPERVLDYVVAHEVCHLLRPDHSPAFWALVRDVDPGADDARRWLREHGPDLHRGPTWRAALTRR